MVAMPSKNIPKDFSIHKIVTAASQEATGAKTNAYLTTTILTGIIFALCSLLSFLLIPLPATILFTSLSLVFALSFSPIRYSLEELLRQLFPGTDYNSHELIKRLNIISYSTLTRRELCIQFFKDLKAGLNVGPIAFIFFTGHSEYQLSPNETGQHFSKLQNSEILHLQSVASLHHQARLKLPDSHSKSIAREHKIHVLVPLVINNQVTGLLLLGPKLDHKAYTTKDIKVLNAIAPKIGYAIQNALSYEAIMTKNQQLLEHIKQANDKLRRANRTLKHDDKLKDEFVFIATHELKNPVTAIRGYLSLIKEGNYGKIPPKLTSAISQLDDSTNQLITLLNNLLQIARTEAERLEIKTKPVAICDVIDTVSQDLQPLINQKSLKIIHTCPNSAIKVMADPDRLQEIINNLISNAIKYSLQGDIIITHEISHDKLITHIKDHGVGIAKKDQPKIFTRFFRVEEEAAKGIPGTGLGLFLVKQMLEKMGGKISFTSKLGSGSTFSVTLPLARTYSLKN